MSSPVADILIRLRQILTYQNDRYLNLTYKIHKFIVNNLADFKRFCVINRVDENVAMNIHTVGLKMIKYRDNVKTQVESDASQNVSRNLKTRA